MSKRCTQSNSLGTNNCNNPYTLGKVIFNDPNKEASEITWLCIEHSNLVIDKLFDTVLVLNKRIEYLDEKIKSSSKTPDYLIGLDEKTYKRQMSDETGHKGKMQDAAKKLRDIKNNLMWNTCRHPLCGKPFSEEDTIYSAVFFTPRGKMRKTIYLHYDCWQKVKGMVGIVQQIQRGQYTIEQTLTK